MIIKILFYCYDIATFLLFYIILRYIFSLFLNRRHLETVTNYSFISWWLFCKLSLQDGSLTWPSQYYDSHKITLYRNERQNRKAVRRVESLAQIRTRPYKYCLDKTPDSVSYTIDRWALVWRPFPRYSRPKKVTKPRHISQRHITLDIHFSSCLASVFIKRRNQISNTITWILPMPNNVFGNLWTPHLSL